MNFQNYEEFSVQYDCLGNDLDVVFYHLYQVEFSAISVKHMSDSFIFTPDMGLMQLINENF